MNKKSLSSIILIFLIFSGTPLLSQNKNEINLSAGFIQIKDDFNQGMVFNGTQINFQYRHLWDLSVVELTYNPKIALGIAFNRGMIAVNINFVPVDISCLKTIYESNRHSVKAGLNFATNYSYQSYPDLQNAHLFWFGEIGFSPEIQYKYQWDGRGVKISLQNSVLGFVSRNTSNDPYFYSLKFSDFIVRPHKHMKFGSFDKYNHTKFRIEYLPDVSKTNSFGFCLEYIEAYFNIHFQSLNYSLQWRKTF